MLSDIELNPTHIEVSWLCEIWRELGTYPQRFSHLHGVWICTPFDSPICDEIALLYEIALTRGYAECL
jgi:hypothetical protein